VYWRSWVRFPSGTQIFSLSHARDMLSIPSFLMFIPLSKNGPGEWRPSSQNLPFQKEIIALLKRGQIRERGSISASGFGPGVLNPPADMDRGVQIRGGSGLTRAIERTRVSESSRDLAVHLLSSVISCWSWGYVRFCFHSPAFFKGFVRSWPWTKTWKNRSNSSEPIVR